MRPSRQPLTPLLVNTGYRVGECLGMRTQVTKTATKKRNGTATPKGKRVKVSGKKNGTGKIRGSTLDIPGFSVRVRDSKIRSRLQAVAGKKGVSYTAFMRNAVMSALGKAEKK